MKTTEILTYKRMGERNKESRVVTEVLLIIMGMLAGRVNLWGFIMPTGISWIIANMSHGARKEKILSAVISSAAGMVLSGVDIFRLRGVVTLIVLWYLAKKEYMFFSENIVATAFFGAGVNLICGGIILGVNSGHAQNYILLCIETFLIVGASLAFGNFIDILERGGNILSDDESISMFISAGVIVAGLGGIGVCGVRISVVAGMYIVIFTAKKCGLGISVTLASIFGIVSGEGDATASLCLYIFLAIGCSLLGSIGKWGIVFGAVLSNTVYIACRMGMDSSVTRIIEITTATALFYFTPGNIAEKILQYTTGKHYTGMGESRLSYHKKQSENVLGEIKGAVNSIAEVVEEMSAQQAEVDAEKEVIKKIKEDICVECALKNYCAEKNQQGTARAVMYILELLKQSGIPDDFQAKEITGKAFDWNCIHKERVVEKVKDCFEFYLKQEFADKQNGKIRRITVAGLEDMSEIIERQQKRINESYENYLDIAEEISEALVRNGIDCYGICVLKNNTGLFEVVTEIEGHSLGETEKIIREITGLAMKTVSEEKSEKGIVLCMREKEHFEYETAILTLDNKERRTGDTTGVFDDGRGCLHCIISDGMGSGVLAAKESGWTVKLYEKLCRAAFEPGESLRMINNIMLAGKCEESCISTDSAKINLLKGTVEFAKAGAASSYIKTQKGAEKIGWSSLPLGILEINSVETRVCDISDGGIVVLVSDGVPDNGADRMEGEHSIRKALEECDSQDPHEIAENLMFASLSMGAPKDDMTILVIKIINKYLN